MAETTKIQWTDATFSPWVGCEKVSPACDHCYAESWAKRTGQSQLWTGERRRTAADYWKGPRKWNIAADAAGIRRRVFCASLSDAFDADVPAEWRVDLWRLIRDTPHLDWLLLTKRPENFVAMLPDDWGWQGYPNVWLGVTVENRAMAALRIPLLLAVDAKVHFLSMEPLLERVALDCIVLPNGMTLNALTGYYSFPHGIGLRRAAELLGEVPTPRNQRVEWVICGGESGGAEARDMDAGWARDLRLQCQAEAVPFFMKQMTRKRGIPDDLLVRQFPQP